MIRYLTIEEERFEDAPFVGALISAISCPIGCKKCFNQKLKDLPIQQDHAWNIIERVKQNPFHEGIILGGLEWSAQPDELYHLVTLALSAKLKVMIYTGYTLEEFLHKIPKLRYLSGELYLKYGSLRSHIPGYQSRFGVHLASGNQKILHYRSIASAEQHPSFIPYAARLYE
jgi:organic radical activating enzyme